VNPSEFDKFAQEYMDLHAASISASGERSEYFVEYKVRDLRDLCHVDGSVGSIRRILDFGAGIGTSVSHFGLHFPDAGLTCVDVSLKSLRIGSERFPDVGFVAFNGRRLPFPDAAFDCVFAACVFHHIDATLHVSLFAELRRVLRPGGLIAIFEHNPLNPLTVRAVNTCPFDEKAILIGAGTLRRRLQAAGFARPATRYRIFFPRALRLLRPLEQWLTWLPLGAQYCAYATR
jgi:SAM-dependent methyltransferase